MHIFIYNIVIIRKEGEYPTSPWYYVTTLSGFMTSGEIFTTKMASQFVPLHRIGPVVTVVVVLDPQTC